MSDTRDRLLAFIIAYTKEHGWAPSITEMSAHLGIVRSAVASQLNKLEGAGKIVRGARMARAIMVCEEEK